MTGNSHIVSADLNTITGSRRLWLVMVAMLPVCACGADARDSEGRSLPDDEQVVADVMPPDRENVLDVTTVEGKSGSSYFHPEALAWYFDRGVVVRRDAGLAELPDAVVVVGGLARYVYNGDGYEYWKFLVTYNEYEGIPAPGMDDLNEFVNERLNDVFVSRDHNVLDVGRVKLVRDERWTWHSPTSFSAQFLIHYRYRTSDSTVEERESRFDIRFYKAAADTPVHALMATELDSNVLSRTDLDPAEISEIKTLRTQFK